MIMDQNMNTEMAVADALKALRDNNIEQLSDAARKALLNANEEALIKAYDDMDGEFSCSKCCNLDNPYVKYPLGIACCATSVVAYGGLAGLIYKLCASGVGHEYFGLFGPTSLGLEMAVPAIPAMYGFHLITKQSKVQEEEPKIQQDNTTENMNLDRINDVNGVSILADNIFLKYLKYVCSLHTYTATDKMCIGNLIRRFCLAKKSRHSNNLNANINLSAKGDFKKI
ncbi:MAG: hypothetical protein IJT15_04735 [Rickettsiales bacterium]|nr:hypothetical protein [Rickettsiales bacterium]